MFCNAPQLLHHYYIRSYYRAYKIPCCRAQRVPLHLYSNYKLACAHQLIPLVEVQKDEHSNSIITRRNKVPASEEHTTSQDKSKEIIAFKPGKRPRARWLLYLDCVVNKRLFQTLQGKPFFAICVSTKQGRRAVSRSFLTSCICSS